MVWRALLELADDHLILSHRLSEWCGHAPMLEEDLALSNMALDLLGTARTLYTRAGVLEGAGRGEDDFAYLREERAFRNCRLVARPNGDFAHTMLRQLLFAALMVPFWRAAAGSADPEVAGVAGKAVKEMGYHLRHAGEWVIRLGDGTGESARRMQAAVGALAPFVDELFEESPAAQAAVGAGVLPARGPLRPSVDAQILAVFAEAGLEMPADAPRLSGGRAGRHGEELGHLLAVMQATHRAHPGAAW